MDRRSFMQRTAAGTLAGAALGTATLPHGLYAASGLEGEINTSLWYLMANQDGTVAEKFDTIKQAGFKGVEIPTLTTDEEVAEFKEASEASGVEIHSIMNMKHWEFPFSSGDPEVVQKGMDAMLMSLNNAKDIGAETVLLVPGELKPDVSYRQAWNRSIENIKELVPVAEEYGVVIGIENVWNKFLLSPMEFAEYIDIFDSESVKAYFDCGNVALFGYPQDWIRELGDRIHKLHVKGYFWDRSDSKWVNLGEGIVDWMAVNEALNDIDYSGWMGAEMRGGDLAYLTDVNSRMEKIIAGEPLQQG